MKRTEFDVVVVGSGAAGLSASLTAAKNGLRTLMIEKGDKWGGSTAKSAGMVWVPGNKQLQRVGGNDNMEMGRTYMKATVGDCTSDEMIDSFLTNGTRAMDFLTANCPGLVWRNMEGYPDYWLRELSRKDAAWRPVPSTRTNWANGKRTRWRPISNRLFRWI